MDKKLAVITGCSGGLGQALCQVFGKNGYDIIGIDLKDDLFIKQHNDLKQHQINFHSYTCDITSREQTKTVFEKILAEHKNIHLLINNAGITNISYYNSATHIDIVEKVMNVNYFGAVNCTSYVLKNIRTNKGGFINISSAAGIVPLLGRTAYSASKFAMNGFFSTLRTELKKDGVHVMNVFPAFISTAINAGNKNATVGNELTPIAVATKILKGYQKQKPSLLIGKVAKKSNFLYKFFPSRFEKMMTKKLESEIK